MPRYNFIEYSDNVFISSGSLWNYYASESKSFKYETKITGKTEARPAQNENDRDADIPIQDPLPNLSVEVTIPLKYLGNFWRSFDLHLINFDAELDLLWTKDCVLVEYKNNITGIGFKITNTKLYTLVVTLSVNDNIKFLENLQQGLKRIVSWNKYRFEIVTQPRNKNLDYMIDSTF